MGEDDETMVLDEQIYSCERCGAPVDGDDLCDDCIERDANR